MNVNKIKQLIKNDECMDIAFRRFQKFKQTDTYDEDYKLEILSELNRYIKKISINEHTIKDIVKKIQISNPTKGSFVYWSNTADLVDFANENPVVVAELLNSLYLDHNRKLSDRIRTFFENGKEFKQQLSLGAPLFGYLLAAYDYKKYPLYKEDVFKAIKKTLGIDRKLGIVSDNYGFYYDICVATQEYFASRNHQLTMLDVQDFFYCLTQYDELKVESAVEFIYLKAKKLKGFSNNDLEFLEKIKDLDFDYLKERRESYRNDKKINKIRYQLLDQYLEQNHLDLADLERIKSEENDQYEENILQSWKNFNILFHIYFHSIKDKVNYQLGCIHQAIRDLDEFEGNDFVKEKLISDFNGMRNLGGSRCWLAVYPKVKENHKVATQLFFGIDEEGIEYGLYYGSKHEHADQSDLEVVTDITDFSYKKMVQKYIEVFQQFLNGNGMEGPITYGPQKTLHPSLSAIFDSEEQAEWAFEFVYQALIKLGIQEPGDERVAVTYTQKQRIHIDFCNWLLIGFYREKKKGVMIVLTLIENEVRDMPYSKGLFTQKENEIQIALTNIPFEEFRSNNQLNDIFERTLPVIYEKFIGYAKSPFLGFNHLVLERAIFDANARKQLFIEGIKINGPEQKEIPTISFDKEIRINNLYFENMESILRQVKTTLQNGKHIIFVGPPGTGKSKLAKEICNSFEANYKMTTATSEWSTYETIGGYQPKSDGTLIFRPGVFLECFKGEKTNEPINKWLIIDEMNRADIDKAFGALFSTLTGDSITLNFQSETGHNIVLRPQKELQTVLPNDYEYIIPNDWRLIGTMNTMDKASLYEMSYAFMRRFAFIPIGVPKDINKDLINNFLDKWNIEGYMYHETLAYVWNQINHCRKIGPAIIEDIAKYTTIDGDFTSAIILYVLPQFEGLGDQEIRGFIERLESFEEINVEQLTDFAEDFFHMKG